MLNWQDAVANIISGVVSALITAVIVYNRFLRRIPAENEKRINQLLNDRLAHESTNHNAQMQALNPNNATVFQTVQNIDRAMIRQEERAKNSYAAMNEDQRAIADSIDRLNTIPLILRDLVKQNEQLRQENAQLQQEKLSLQDKLRIYERQAWQKNEPER